MASLCVYICVVKLILFISVIYCALLYMLICLYIHTRVREFASLLTDRCSERREKRENEGKLLTQAQKEEAKVTPTIPAATGATANN